MVFLSFQEKRKEPKEKPRPTQFLRWGAKQGKVSRRKANITCRQTNFTVKQLHSPKANITDMRGIGFVEGIDWE